IANAPRPLNRGGPAAGGIAVAGATLPPLAKGDRMIRIWTLGLLAASLPGLAQAADIAGTRAAIGRSLDAQYSHIDALYKDIHRHPELGFQEQRTAAKLAAEMKALGYDVTERVGETGIVVLYKNGP